MVAQTTCGIESEPAVRPRRSSLRIGEVALALDTPSLGKIRLSRELEAFCGGSGNPDIEVNVDWADRLQSWPAEKAFNSGGLWALFRDGSDFVFDFVSPVFGDRPYKRMRTDRDFRSVRLILNRAVFGAYPTVYPLEYPVDELLITNYLASGASPALGVEVHGCGLMDTEAGGQLFLGHSGAGKSTTTQLWEALRNPEILSDDRIILRLEKGELWMYGTPWHGETAFASAGKARINRIFILEHGERNEMIEMSRARAAGELFARCFPPFHSAAGLERTVEFLNQVVEAVPCYEFRFVPDASAVEAVIGFHG